VAYHALRRHPPPSALQLADLEGKSYTPLNAGFPPRAAHPP
jgi:hypothetical protein